SQCGARVPRPADRVLRVAVVLELGRVAFPAAGGRAGDVDAGGGEVGRVREGLLAARGAVGRGVAGGRLLLAGGARCPQRVAAPISAAGRVVVRSRMKWPSDGFSAP